VTLFLPKENAPISIRYIIDVTNISTTTTTTTTSASTINAITDTDTTTTTTTTAKGNNQIVIFISAIQR
jgi:hypothetical protein